MFKRPPRRIKFVGAELQRLSDNQCLARVQLQQAGSGSYVGTAVGASPDEEGLRVTARATAAALMQSVGRDHSLQVQGVKVFQAFGKPVVLVELAAQQEQGNQTLMGFCLAGTDPTRAAALAVLHATNRALDAG